MSYKTSHLFLRAETPDGRQIWDYSSTDSFATISGSNYFADALVRGMAVGDLISAWSFSTELPNNLFSGFSSFNLLTINSVGSSGATAIAPPSLSIGFQGFVNVKTFGATGDGVTDDTAAIQAAINSITGAGTVYFPYGTYSVSSKITNDGTARHVNLLGQSGGKQVLPGGAVASYSSVIQWTGANNGVMFEFDTVMNVSVKNLCLQTRSLSSDDSTQDITGVYGIRFINKSVCRYVTVEECTFSLLYAPIHFYDDGSNGSSNDNMDGHRIEQCVFNNNTCGVLVEQSNVYNTLINCCSFPGSPGITKNHIWIKKGHVNLTNSYIGKLKDASSSGGKDGIALRIQNGWINASNVYSEADNGPFLDWESNDVAGVSCVISGCNILNQTATLPGTYNLINRTNEIIVIVGGRISGAVNQLTATTGSIVFHGTTTPTVDSASGVVDAVSCNTATVGGWPNVIGSLPTGTSGGGQAMLRGYSPALNFLDLAVGASIYAKYTGDLLRFDKPGYVNGPRFNFASSVVDLTSGNWGMSVVNVGVGQNLSAGALIGIAAGTASAAPLQLTSGTNLTSAAAGALEYDGVQIYGTTDTTGGRGAIPIDQYFHLTANGSNISTIANFFGATSNISLVANAYYLIDIEAFFTVTGGTPTVTWTLTNSAAPTSQNIYYEMSPATGVVAPPGTATMLVGQIINDATATKALNATAALSATSHYMRMRIWLKNGTGTSLKIQATASTNSITPLLGSMWRCRRISPNNIGTFAA